jgi:hypothetical protein
VNMEGLQAPKDNPSRKILRQDSANPIPAARNPASPPFNLAPSAFPTWSAAVDRLSMPSYFYHMMYDNDPLGHTLPDEEEVFQLRNHERILEVEQTLSNFHLQLKACYVWANDQALEDLLWRLRAAGEGMEMLEQPVRMGGRSA